ncbi:MAG: methyltransferase domain-containing protein [Deltaproteobacteria bacterium]|nr:methyltransferase domain-containing protein [Deltaproteobacteria bacterium]
MENLPGVGEPAYWEAAYARGADRWELGEPAPPLVALLNDHPPPPGRVAVLGCGRGHDARLLARRGCEVWGFDFAEPAIREARELARHDAPAPRFEQRDLFTLPEAYPAFFDGIWEYTCFCAIDPARRAEYVECVRKILRPRGWFLALFYPLDAQLLGPPFPVSQDEVHHLFDPFFEFEASAIPDTSIPRRLGKEWLVRATLKPRID